MTSVASFRKRGKKWEYRVNWTDVDGEKHTKSNSGYVTKSAAVSAAQEVEIKLGRGSNPVESDASFLEYWDRWLKAYKSGNKSANTEYRYQLLRSHLAKRFTGRKLKSIRGVEWQEFLNDLASGKDRKSKQPRSRDFISKMNSYVRSMVKSAINDQILYSDFTFNARVDGQVNTDKIKYLELSDFKKLKHLAAKKASYSSTGCLAIYLATMTGMRISEILALTWPDIDAEHRIIYINKTWDYHSKAGFKDTKTPASVRDIEVPDSVFKILSKIKKEQKISYLKTGYRDGKNMVMRGRQHTVPTDNACNKALIAMQKEIGVKKEKRITFHGLRHSHVSYLISQGVDIYYISQRLGHSNIAITLKVYSHLLKSHRKEEAQKSVRFLEQL